MEIPVILTGDFNSNMKRYSAVFRIILELFKTDRRLFDNENQKFNLLISKYPEISRTNYDYIFVSKELTIEELDVLGDLPYFSVEKNAFVYPSDHKALMSFIKFPDNTQLISVSR